MKVTTEDTTKGITKTKIPRHIIIKSPIKTLRVYLTLMEKRLMFNGQEVSNTTMQQIIKAIHD